MTDSNKTTFENRCNILAEVWLDYRRDEQFKDFVDYNDLGLPLGFLVAENLVKPSDLATQMVEESFDLLLAALGVDDEGFESLEEMLS